MVLGELYLKKKQSIVDIIVYMKATVNSEHINKRNIIWLSVSFAFIFFGLILSFS